MTGGNVTTRQSPGSNEYPIPETMKAWVLGGPDELSLVEKKVPYEVNGRQFEGKIVYDDSVKGKRPLVYMQPDWKGVDKDTTGQAQTVAGKDYVVLMAMTPDSALSWAGTRELWLGKAIEHWPDERGYRDAVLRWYAGLTGLDLP